MANGQERHAALHFGTVPHPVEDWEKMVRVLGEIVQERSDKRGKHNDSARAKRRRPTGKGLKKYSPRAGEKKVSIGERGDILFSVTYKDVDALSNVLEMFDDLLKELYR